MHQISIISELKSSQTSIYRRNASKNQQTAVCSAQNAKINPAQKAGLFLILYEIL